MYAKYKIDLRYAVWAACQSKKLCARLIFVVFVFEDLLFCRLEAGCVKMAGHQVCKHCTGEMAVCYLSMLRRSL